MKFRQGELIRIDIDEFSRSAIISDVERWFKERILFTEANIDEFGTTLFLKNEVHNYMRLERIDIINGPVWRIASLV